MPALWIIAVLLLCLLSLVLFLLYFAFCVHWPSWLAEGWRNSLQTMTGKSSEQKFEWKTRWKCASCTIWPLCWTKAFRAAAATQGSTESWRTNKSGNNNIEFDNNKQSFDPPRLPALKMSKMRDLGAVLHTSLSRFWAVLTLYKRAPSLTSEAADFNGSRLLLSFINRDQYQYITTNCTVSTQELKLEL